MRTREGSFADAVYRSSRSAVGVYDEATQEWQRDGHRYDLDGPAEVERQRRAAEEPATAPAVDAPAVTRPERAEW